ncbi:DUF1294 domain-containing protein [Anaerosphaera multitolerans]|uniref:DUF1294 domain-containing protein n=1 Tax=Anaerosphaera multitolerans TaxID=2487351 RepID=A0A437S510_9FIRM|nr:DUF1294 domain-containing protein [Anaerosphaera multitolerans]RVU54105.1 DUF1294 domain-containing protein [Anaerosphaera multitolerans]
MYQLNKSVIYYLIFINLFSFFLYFLDKRRAIARKSRISEHTLLLTTFLFGSVGALTAMAVFHHKTKKWKFKILVPVFLIIQCFLIFYFIQ